MHNPAEKSLNRKTNFSDGDLIIHTTGFTNSNKSQNRGDADSNKQFTEGGLTTTKITFKNKEPVGDNVSETLMSIVNREKSDIWKFESSRTVNLKSSGLVSKVTNSGDNESVKTGIDTKLIIPIQDLNNSSSSEENDFLTLQESRGGVAVSSSFKEISDEKNKENEKLRPPVVIDNKRSVDGKKLSSLSEDKVHTMSTKKDSPDERKILKEWKPCSDVSLRKSSTELTDKTSQAKHSRKNESVSSEIDSKRTVVEKSRKSTDAERSECIKKRLEKVCPLLMSVI